jgi:hypothetical protein
MKRAVRRVGARKRVARCNNTDARYTVGVGRFRQKHVAVVASKNRAAQILHTMLPRLTMSPRLVPSRLYLARVRSRLTMPPRVCLARVRSRLRPARVPLRLRLARVPSRLRPARVPSHFCTTHQDIHWATHQDASRLATKWRKEQRFAVEKPTRHNTAVVTHEMVAIQAFGSLVGVSIKHLLP